MRQGVVFLFDLRVFAFFAVKSSLTAKGAKIAKEPRISQKGAATVTGERP